MSQPPLHDPFAGYRELTLRGMVLGALLTVIFTASNVYLGLKVGMTFASTIPAAVISMVVLKFASGSNILENNLVKTQASSAGTISCIIFILPGLLMAGYWTGFPFWQTTLVVIGGGILGVIFTIPLRLAMVVNTDLPYPEGVAAAEILKVGCPDPHFDDGVQGGGSSGIKEIISGGVIASVMSVFTAGFRLFADSASLWFASGKAVFQVPMGFSFALLGAGYLVGLAGGIAILVGTILAWFGFVPYLTSCLPQPADSSIMDFATAVWKEKVRFIGAGTLAIASVWTLITLFKPMLEGLKISFSAFSGSKAELAAQRAETNLSPKAMLFWMGAMAILLLFCFRDFVGDAEMPAATAWILVISCVLLAFIVGFLVAAACGYMAGLIGSSSSPISGIGIVATIIISIVLLLVSEATGFLDLQAGNRDFMIALVLFCGTAVVSAASISNDNLQDLKTGYLLKATPWRQQVALIIGVIVGGLVIAPVLDLLYQSYGFQGAPLPRPETMDIKNAMSAPQATIMTQIATGIFTHKLEWTYIFIGFGVGVVGIVFNLILKKVTHDRLALPPLAIGMGIFLPPTLTPPLIIGAILGALTTRIVRRRHPQNSELALKKADRTGTLFAAGLIVGESLVGVLLALVIVISVTSGGSENPLALHLANWDSAAQCLGLAAFIACALFFGRRIVSSVR